MNSASKGCSGTGPFEALLFGQPTLPHVHVRRTWMTVSAKLTSCHCSPRHSEMRRPVPAAKSVRVRSGSLRLSNTAYACSGVRIIGTRGGLVRFDGIRFVPWSLATESSCHRLRSCRFWPHKMAAYSNSRGLLAVRERPSPWTIAVIAPGAWE